MRMHFDQQLEELNLELIKWEPYVSVLSEELQTSY